MDLALVFSCEVERKEVVALVEMEILFLWFCGGMKQDLKKSLLWKTGGVLKIENTLVAPNKKPPQDFILRRLHFNY